MKVSNVRSPSVSLSKITNERNDSPEKNCPKGKVFSKRKRDSPPPRDSVKNKRMIFEEKLAKKYQAQGCAKELAREKGKSKKEKQKKDNAEEESSIAILLHE